MQIAGVLSTFFRTNLIAKLGQQTACRLDAWCTELQLQYGDFPKRRGLICRPAIGTLCRPPN